MKFLKTALWAAALATQTFAGEDGSLSGDVSNPGQTSPRTGIFLDSPIINIGYRTETLEGVTNSLGEYNYVNGETVTFFIGALELPCAPASATITPLDLVSTKDTLNPAVVNIVRLLQTLDRDGNPDNGIEITGTAKASATQVDFTLPESDFESSHAVVNLVVNGGQETAITSLIAVSDAVSHFEGSLVENDIDFIPNFTITGTWINNETENDLLVFVFFRDGTYLHAEVDLDDHDETSGMEWGTYSRDSETGKMTVAQVFDRNGGTGLTDAAGGAIALFTTISDDVLTLSFDDNQNGSIDEGESLEFQRQ